MESQFGIMVKVWPRNQECEFQSYLRNENWMSDFGLVPVSAQLTPWDGDEENRRKEYLGMFATLSYF